MTARHLHLMGLGGVGRCGLAEVLHARGVKVSGCDLAASDRTERLQVLGIDVFLGHGEATTLRSRSPMGIGRLRAWNQEWKRKPETKEKRRAQPERTPKDYEGVKGRLCSLTEGGLTGVMRLGTRRSHAERSQPVIQ